MASLLKRVLHQKVTLEDQLERIIRLEKSLADIALKLKTSGSGGGHRIRRPIPIPVKHDDERDQNNGRRNK